MKITIEVPGMKCAKCDSTAAIQPVFLYVKGIVPPQFREMLTSVVKERADVHAADNSGRAWEVFSDDKPAGWAKGPGEVDLCADCNALWAQAGKAFLAPPPAEPVQTAPVKATPVAAPVHQPRRELTVSEIVASKNHGGTTPTNNSMMSPAPPTTRR